MKKFNLNVFALGLILHSSLFILHSATAAAQTPEDRTIFRAMETELDRSMEQLDTDGVGKPFWMGYIYSDIRSMHVAATLGEVVTSQFAPQRFNATRVLLGDNSMTSDINYNSHYTPRGSAVETDEGQIRRELWLNTDANYKQTAPNMARKATMRRQGARTPEEEALPDLLPVEASETIAESPVFGFDRVAWEQAVASLSAIFADYPTLYGSRVAMSAYDWTNYAATSEDVRIKHPVSFAVVQAEATVRTPDGEELSDRIEIYAPSDLTLPPEETLRARIADFARNLSEWAEARKFGDFYSGPVLFVGQPVFKMFDDNLLTNNGNGLLVRRRSETSANQGGGMIYFGGGAQPGSASRRLENRTGQRVLDRKLTVTNHSTLPEYEGTPLLGYYEVDADGVVPPAANTVIEEGMLCGVLNGRIPTLKSPASTGSNRFSINISPIVAPGTLEVTVTDGKTVAELEKELVALAAADGLKYAYVVERMSGKMNLVRRIDVATGEQTLVRNAEIQPMGLTQLKRVAGVSQQREVRNYLAGQVPASMIYPSAMLLEDVEIGEMETSREKPSPIVNPLQRNEE